MTIKIKTLQTTVFFSTSCHKTHKGLVIPSLLVLFDLYLVLVVKNVIQRSIKSIETWGFWINKSRIGKGRINAMAN